MWSGPKSGAIKKKKEDASANFVLYGMREVARIGFYVSVRATFRHFLFPRYNGEAGERISTAISLNYCRWRRYAVRPQPCARDAGNLGRPFYLSIAETNQRNACFFRFLSPRSSGGRQRSELRSSEFFW